MYKRWLGILLLATLLVGCGRSAAPVATPAIPAPMVEPGSHHSGGGVSASGEIVPLHETQLSFTVAGRVQTVAVTLGDEVEPDEVLVALETGGLEAQVAQAEAAVESAQANLARLAAVARPEEIATAEAAVSLAGAGVAQAAAARDAAEAQCAAMQPGVEAAQAALKVTQAQSRQLEAGPPDGQVAAAAAQVKLAEVQAHQAQAAYDRVQGASDIEMRPEALALEQATIACEAAQAQYQALFQQVTKEDKQAAAAQVEAARIQVARAREQATAICAQARQAVAAVEAAQAQQTQAEQQLALLKAGATEEEIATAEAQVNQAEAAVQAARVALDQARLSAPSGGMITALQIDAGETVMPGQVVVTLADLSLLRVETTDLSERDVAGVSVGQRASVYVEALGAEIQGRVAGVAPQATTIGGDVVYAVYIQLDEQLPGLRWGMSADVEIATE
jgi:multidrug resistance efflux pump